MWLAALAALRLPASGGFALAAGFAVGAGCVEVYARRGRGVLLGILVAGLLGAASGAGVVAWKVAVRDNPTIHRLAAAGVEATGDLVVRDDPRPSAGGRDTWLVPVRLVGLRTVSGEQYAVDVRALVFGADPAWGRLLPGQRVRAEGRLGPARGGTLEAAVWTARDGPVEVGPPSWWQEGAGGLRAGLREVCARLPPEVGGLLPGLVVGDVGMLDPRVAEDFRATGMMHLTAVSGANVALVVGAVLLVARWCGLRRRWALPVAGLALIGLVIVVRPSPSVLRAAVMGAIGLLALALGRPRRALPMLGAAVALLILLDPGLAGSPGFALSVLATGGLLAFAGPWSAVLRRRGWPRWLADALVVPAAAQLVVAPVVAGLSGSVSLVSVPVNALAVPAVAPATVLGVLAALCAGWWPSAAYVLVWLASWPAWWLVRLARHGAALPLGGVPWPAGWWGGVLLALLLAAVLLGLRARRVRRWTALVCVLALAAFAGILPARFLVGAWPPAGAVFVACDVGQGDALVLPVGPGTAVVVDTGPDPAAADRCLRRLGVTRIPLLVLSHFHQDHVGGLPGVLAGRDVAGLLVPAFGEPGEGRRAVYERSTAGGIRVAVPALGDRITVGALELTVLGPREPVTGTRSDPNNNSLVLLARTGGVSILLAGDMEEQAQADLMAGGTGLDVDVLKVAHHGSAYQDPAFLAATRPALAVVSVGADNDYGHPDPRVLAVLRGEGAVVARTDRDGDVAAVVRDGHLAVATRGGGGR